MNREEAITLCRLARAAFPATAVDEFTPDAWALAFEGDRFEDAREALRQLMREQTFIHCSDIAKRIGRIRGARLTAFGPLPDPPRGLSDEGERAWLKALRTRIADGDTPDLQSLLTIPTEAASVTPSPAIERNEP